MSKAITAWVMALTLLVGACGSQGEILGAQRSADGRLIRLVIAACLADLTTVVDETPDEVVVRVRARNAYEYGDCAGSTAIRLLEPLGERPLVDGSTGKTVEVIYDESVLMVTRAITPLGSEQSETGVWSVYELDALEPRLGMGGAVADGNLLFLWGGLREETGSLFNNGVIIDLTTGAVDLTLPAPLDGRLDSRVVWTGTEFVVFGGRDLRRAFTDAAAYNPASMTWRLLPSVPVAAASGSTVVFTSGAVYVWLPARGGPFGADSRMGRGQFLRYRPGSDGWEVLAPPPVRAPWARLLALDGSPVLVMGPQLPVDGRSSGTPVPVIATWYDPVRDSWGAPIGSAYETEAASAAIMNNAVVALLADGSVLSLTGTSTSWTRMGRIPASCATTINASGGRSRIYFGLCGDLFVGEEDGIRALPLPRSLTDWVEPFTLCCDGVMEVADDMLILLSRAGPAGSGEPFDRNVLVLYSPRDPG